MTNVTDWQCGKMAKALVDFGYPEVSPSDVRDLVAILEAGEDPEDVIGMFIKGWLEDAGLL